MTMRKATILLSCLARACFGSRVLKPASAFNVPTTSSALAKTPRGFSAAMETREDLKEMSKKLNPIVGYWDPLGLGGQKFWGSSNEATIGFLRQAEIKHGRVAMAAFVGYVLQSNGVYFPAVKLNGDGMTFKDIAAAGSPPDQWDALPTSAKAQIILFIGFLEMWGESSAILGKEGYAHYMKGGVPGKFPTFDAAPHDVPFNLWDPFRVTEGMSREKLDKKLLAEINNGRLAQIGIMSFLAEQKAPGQAVPLLKGLVPPYAGEPMAAFSATNADLPGVTEMLNLAPKFR